MKSGKRFEDNFKKSVPEDCFFYRLRDNPAFMGSNLKFTTKNPCDCFIFRKGNLFLIELKSIKGKCIPLSKIRDNQIKTFSIIQENLITGLIVNFSEEEKTYFLDGLKVLNFIKNEERKSIPITFFETEGIEIKEKLLRVNKRYDIGSFLKRYEGE